MSNSNRQPKLVGSDNVVYAKGSAIFNKKMKTLKYRTSRNTCTYRSCETIQEAKNFLDGFRKTSNLSQKLEVK